MTVIPASGLPETLSFSVVFMLADGSELHRCHYLIVSLDEVILISHSHPPLNFRGGEDDWSAGIAIRMLCASE